MGRGRLIKARPEIHPTVFWTLVVALAIGAVVFLVGCVPSAPAWSSDGALVAVVQPADLGHAVVVLDARTGAEAARWRTEEVVLAPRWAPAGGGGRRLHFVTVPEDRGDFRRAAYWSWDVGAGEPEVLFRAPADGRSAHALSYEPGPDGAGLHVERGRGGRYAIRLRPARGRDRPLVEREGDAALPRWSPDGARVAYLARAEGAGEGAGAWDLRVVGADGALDRLLVAEAVVFPAGEGADALPAADLFAPTWSPDGTRLAYVRARPLPDTAARLSVRAEVWETDLDGNARPVARPPGSAAAPAWGPDGRLAFVAGASRDEAAVHVAAGAAGEWGYERAVPPNERVPEAGAPAWSPDGRRLAWRIGGPTDGTVRVRDLAAGTDAWLTVTALGAARVGLRALERGDAAGALPHLERAAERARTAVARP